MPWFKADDGLSDNAKTRRAGTEAMGLWLLAGTWCARELTDGFVPKVISARWDSRGKYARKLVDAGFWEPAEKDGEDGYQFLKWAEYQPTKAEVDAERAAAAKRMRAARARRKGVALDGERSDDVRPNVRPNERGTFGDTSPEVPPDFERSSAAPTRPDPINDHLGGESPVAGAREKDGAPPSRRCPEHADGPMRDCEACRAAMANRTWWTAARVVHDIRPPNRCPEHIGFEIPPYCGGCRDARLAGERWDAEHAEQVAAAKVQARARAAAAKAKAITACGMCDKDGYVGTIPCDHDPATTAPDMPGKVAARISACRFCDSDGLLADGSTCDHKPPRKGAPPSRTEDSDVA